MRTREINKNVHVWICCFLFGVFGVDRFVRRQYLLGVIKFALMFFYVGEAWLIIDWIIAMVKAYGSAYGNEKMFYFDASGAYL